MNEYRIVMVTKGGRRLLHRMVCNATLEEGVEEARLVNENRTLYGYPESSRAVLERRYVGDWEEV